MLVILGNYFEVCYVHQKGLLLISSVTEVFPLLFCLCLCFCLFVVTVLFSLYVVG